MRSRAMPPAEVIVTAQLTQRWGVRPAGRGKTVWAEQAITPVP